MRHMLAAVLLVATALSPAPSQSSGGRKSRHARTERELTRLEEEWHNAYVRHDPAPLERLLADEYTAVGGNGGSSNKAQTVAGLKADTSTYEYSTPYDMDMRFYGDTVVVVGRTKEKWRNKNGEESTAEYRWTDVFVRRAGRWQCVAAQVARVPPAKPRQASAAAEEAWPLAEQIDDFIRGLAAEDEFSGAVLVARHGRPMFVRAYGLASKEFNVPNRVDTKFNLASMTKMFTGVAVGQPLPRRGSVGPARRGVPGGLPVLARRRGLRRPAGRKHLLTRAGPGITTGRIGRAIRRRGPLLINVSARPLRPALGDFS